MYTTCKWETFMPKTFYDVNREMGTKLQTLQTLWHRYKLVFGKVFSSKIYHLIVRHFFSFRNKLKTVYLGGKRNRWVDTLLTTLLQVEKHQFVQFIQKIAMKPINRREKKEMKFHENFKGKCLCIKVTV